MQPRSDEERLAVLLEHWMDHNDGHAREFRDWAERAGALGLARVCEGIRRAAEQMDEANGSLRAALATLKER